MYTKAYSAMTRIRVVVLLAALLLAPLFDVQAQSDDVFTPYHIAKMRLVGATAVSPDGSKIAYTLSVPRDPYEENGPAWTELHIVETATGDDQPYITGKNSVSQISWTPDGQSISFLSRRSGDNTTSLYVIPVNGGEARKAASFRTSILAYDWHPDGERLVFIAEEPKDKRSDLPYKPEIYEEETPQRRVWVTTAFSDVEPRMLNVEGSAYNARWNPVSDQIAIAVAPSPYIDDYYMYQRVKVVDAGTGAVVSEIENPGKLGKFAWSPDGSKLALISGADINDPAAGRLMVVPASGGKPTELLPGYEGDVEDFEWLDASTLRYTTVRGVETYFEQIGADGSGRTQLLDPGDASLLAFSMSRDGRVVSFTADSPSHPNEAFSWNPGQNGLKRLTDSNPWLSGLRLARQEVVKFKAKDGLELEGILIHPLERRGSERVPLILVVHGGPESHYKNGWLTGYSSFGQLAAARGFAVFYPNYRGSTGRGVAFSKLSQGDPAGLEFDDLVDAVDHLIEIGLVDRDKVGVTGGSYGGYATAWLSTRYSDRFAAGVMFVGISNKISKVGTTDIPNEEFLVHARKRPWENWQFFLERSPIYYAENARTPLLILHGKEDPRVNPGQSHELYRHLKLHGKAPVRLVLYPGEGHGNRNSTARFDYTLRSLRWMEHYLKGPGGEKPPVEIDYGQPFEVAGAN